MNKRMFCHLQHERFDNLSILKYMYCDTSSMSCYVTYLKYQSTDSRRFHTPKPILAIWCVLLKNTQCLFFISHSWIYVYYFISVLRRIWLCATLSHNTFEYHIILIQKRVDHVLTQDMFNFAYVINSKYNKSYLPGVW